jgi:hypothetical protein
MSVNRIRSFVRLLSAAIVFGGGATLAFAEAPVYTDLCSECDLANVYSIADGECTEQYPSPPYEPNCPEINSCSAVWNEVTQQWDITAWYSCVEDYSGCPNPYFCE